MEKKILIIGLSKSGIAAAKLAKTKGFSVYITEKNEPKDEFKAVINELKALGIMIETGGHTENFIEGSEFAVASPGVPPKAEIYKLLENKKIPVISEIEFAYKNSKTPFIAITGTNGKTTTTALISHMLNYKYKAPVCGNIGVPPSSLVLENNDFLVCEVSSYQAEKTVEFKPYISIWTNFTPDHIDWHGSLENYFNAKAKIFLGEQTPKYAVLNANDKKLSDFAQNCINSKVFLFDTEENDNSAYISHNAIYYKENGQAEKIIDLKDCSLIGHHNYQNIMCAVITAKILGMDNTDIVNGLKTFKAPDHRLEKVRDYKDITFYNDSKATNPEASIVAINSFNNKNVTLILGGRDKNTDLTEMCDSINKHITTVILIGEATQRFKENLLKNGFNNIIEEGSLEGAIDRAIDIKPDVVLLSPACASFDMFKSYEDRGEVFKKYVLSK